MTTLQDIETEPVAPGGNGAAPEGEWRADKNGKEYVPRQDGKGILYRVGEESIAQALERDAKPRDKRPRPKSKRPKLPPAPTKIDLKELEKSLAEALKTPGMICATFGDEWAAEHFIQMGPLLARNLVTSSEHNPWLRRKLEEAATGQEATMKLVSLVGVGGALFAYAIPPIVWWLNLPVPDKARQMFGIPDKREHAPAPPAPASPIPA